jgi:hypothetical protein
MFVCVPLLIKLVMIFCSRVFQYFYLQSVIPDRLCGPVVRVPGYISKDPGFESRHYHIFYEVLGMERGPFSLVRVNEELLEWKSSESGSRKPRLTAMDSVALIMRQP